jgi:protoporphyrin/coproporphyrin ferrochelatase
MTDQYDAFLLVSFGGPEGMDDVIPFLRNVLRGRNVPEERLQQVARHYALFNGVSPINGQNRVLIEALNHEFQANDIKLPIYWGNRNWHPLLNDTLRQMRDDGINRALGFFTSAYSSYSGCRQYLENIDNARLEVGEGAPRIDRLRPFYNHPGFIQACVDRLNAALADFNEVERSSVTVAFTAHSIPLSMAADCDYKAQLEETASLVSRRCGITDWQLAFQSRSGPPTQPWLEPDIGDHLRTLRTNGVVNVVIAPIGFISDHMEVIYDLDTEAQAVGEQLGMRLARSATVGTHPRFVSMIRELVEERLDPTKPRLFEGTRGPSPDICPVDCCPSGARPKPVSQCTQ